MNLLASTTADQVSLDDFGKDPFWLVLLMTPDTFLWQGVAFALFRLFDITKPQPARYFDEHVKNGFGVMADDLVAAGYTLLSLALLKLLLA